MQRQDVKIVSRLNFELRFKLKLRQCLHSDTADRLHLMCCNAQKSKESLRALLCAKKLQKHTVEPGLVPEKLDTILTQPRKKGKRAQYDARRRAKICSKTPPGMKEYPRVIEWRLVAPQEARKSHEVGLLFRKIFLKGRRESFSDCGNPSGEHPPKNWILFLTWIPGILVLFLKNRL